MARLLQFLISLAVGMAVFLVIMAKIGMAAISQAVGLFFNTAGLLAVALTAIFTLIEVLRWKIVLRSQGKEPSLKALLPLSLIGQTFCYLTPFALFGGEIFRVYFAKQKFPLWEGEKIVASVAVDKILKATLFFVFLIFGLLAFGLFSPISFSGLGIGALVVAGFFIFLLGLFYFKNWQKKSALKWLCCFFGARRFLKNENMQSALLAEKEAFKFFALKNKSFWLCLGLSALAYLALLARAFILIFFLTGELSLMKSFAVAGFALLATLAPLPAALGALEAAMGFVFAAMGLGFKDGAVFSLLWRSADIVIVLFGIWFFAKNSVSLATDKLFGLFHKRTP